MIKVKCIRVLLLKSMLKWRYRRHWRDIR